MDRFSRICLLIIAISAAYLAMNSLFWTLGDLFAAENEEIYEALDQLFERVEEIEKVID